MSEQQSSLARRADPAKDASSRRHPRPGGRRHDRQVDAVLVSLVGVTLFVGLVIWFVFRAMHPVVP